MSLQIDETPSCTPCDSSEAIARIIETRERDLDGLAIRRVLPSAQQRMVGPFIFFDHMGPNHFDPGAGIDVRPHPHINLETVTYLFEGEIMHRDSLGVEQAIRPGAVNWMTAGSGIVHSERSAVDRSGERPLHGLQLWLALPRDQEEIDPAFQHHPAESIPEVTVDGVTVRVIAGEAYGVSSPVRTRAPLVYLEARMPAGSSLELFDDFSERAAYAAMGRLRVDKEVSDTPRMYIFNSGRAATLHAETDARVMLLGGEPYPEKRTIWWNFVSSRSERIERAKDDWNADRFPKVPGDESERIPLPGH